jgi:hypothetical protein
MRAPGERQEKAQPLGPVVRPGEYVKPSEEKMKAIEVERFERVQYDRVGGVDYLAEAPIQ